MKKSKKGFIGPLGDDIPSIFPIVAGMLLFIGTILYVNAQVDSRNVELQQMQATQQLAYLATQKASFQPGEFQHICETSLLPFAKNNGLKFAVVVKRFCSKGCATCESGIDLQNSNIYNEDENAGESELNPNNVCTNDKEEIRNVYLSARLEKSLAPSNGVVLIYPFTVPCPDSGSPTNGLGTLNVIVWR